jgi:hypothetical protein
MQPIRPKKHQPRSEDVQGAILAFIQNHFYQGHAVAFMKDRPRLLQWVVWRLAKYLDAKAVTIPNERYIEIMLVKPGILMEALRNGDTGNITYLPAWLGRCVETHLNIHGEDYYDEGKALRNHLDGALKIAHAGLQGRDAVREMAQASRLLKPAKKRRRAVSGTGSKNEQATLF